MDLSAQAAGIGALAEPLRLALYHFVISQPDAVGREAAASALGVPVHTARFHLDRMVDDGLLEVEFRRTSGRTGPGAGRPTKLYRRSGRQFDVTLPERRYDLAGHILAAAIEAAGDGVPLADALHEAAHAEGRRLGERATGTGDDLDRLAAALAAQGYEPRREDDTVALTNCPFDTLAKAHKELICALNRSYVQGVADGLGGLPVRACLEPTPGHCCVKARRDRDTGRDSPA